MRSQAGRMSAVRFLHRTRYCGIFGGYETLRHSWSSAVPSRKSERGSGTASALEGCRREAVHNHVRYVSYSSQPLSRQRRYGGEGGRGGKGQLPERWERVRASETSSKEKASQMLLRFSPFVDVRGSGFRGPTEEPSVKRPKPRHTRIPRGGPLNLTCYWLPIQGTVTILASEADCPWQLHPGLSLLSQPTFACWR